MDRIILSPTRWDILKYRWASLRSAWRPPSDRDSPYLKWMDELFARLYTENHVAPAKYPVRGWAKWALKFHELASSTPEYQQLAAQCAGDVVNSAIAADAIYDAIKEDFDDDDGDGDGGDGDGTEGKENDKKGKGKLRDRVAAAMKAAAAKVSRYEQAMEGFGRMAGNEKRTTMDEIERERIHSLLKIINSSRQFQKIMQLAGKFRRIAASMREELVRHGADDVADLERGSEIESVLPEEIAKLKRSPAERLLFLSDLAGDNAMQYRVEGKDRKGAGPIVVLLDKSGSMSGAPDTWATAVALAMLQVASAEKREFVFAPFTCEVDEDDVRRVKPGDYLDPSSLLRAADGGTSIINALSFAKDEILRAAAERGSRFSKADIICITDDQDNLSPASIKKLKAELHPHGTRIVGIGIGEYAGQEGQMPWAHESYLVKDPSSIDRDLAVTLFTPRAA